MVMIKVNLINLFLKSIYEVIVIDISHINKSKSFKLTKVNIYKKKAILCSLLFLYISLNSLDLSSVGWSLIILGRYLIINLYS